jgi:hypothetical protein
VSAAGDVQVDAGHMPLARQRDEVDQRVGVALVQLGRAERREARVENLPSSESSLAPSSTLIACSGGMSTLAALSE